MNHQEIINFIFQIADKTNAFDLLDKTFSRMPRESLSNALLYCGVIPESFQHDSSEEKLWAKYCDILLAESLIQLGLNAQVLRTRGNSADVFASSANYTLVGDAKAFRLSRTAKNQKDFKIKALDDWRRSDTYACLVSPLYQYPRITSQIYGQSVERNVTLLSYIHLKFLIDNCAGQDLSPLWLSGRALNQSNNANFYWDAIDTVICQLLGKDSADLVAYKHQEVQATKTIGEEGIVFWSAKVAAYKKLTQAQAIQRLIKAEKIETKIFTIRRMIQSLESIES